MSVAGEYRVSVAMNGQPIKESIPQVACFVLFLFFSATLCGVFFALKDSPFQFIARGGAQHIADSRPRAPGAGALPRPSLGPGKVSSEYSTVSGLAGTLGAEEPQSKPG